MQSVHKASSSSPVEGTRRQLAAQMGVLLVFIIFSLSLYWPAITSGLVSDDWGLSMPNTAPWTSFLGAWFGGGHGPFYRPLSRILIYYEARAFGYGGLAQHLISHALFLGSIALTALAVRKRSGNLGAFVTAIIIVTSPIAAATVSWVSSQTDLLATYFLCLALALMARDPRQITVSRAAYSAFACLVCYLSKDSAVVLGPLGLVYAAMLLYHSGVSAFKTSRPAMIWGIGNFLFLFVYLGFRLWRLGQINASTTGPFTPDKGWIWHGAQQFLTGLRDFAFPLVQLFPPVSSDSIGPFSSLWPAFLTVLIIIYLLAIRKTITAFLLVGFVVTMAPLITAPLRVYPEVGMDNIRRFLYMPLFFFAAGIGLLCDSKAFKDSHPPALLVCTVIIFGFFQSSVAQIRIADYGKAGEFRDNLIDKLNDVLATNDKPVDLFIGRLPDKIGEAYSFRNGSEEMVKVLFPKTRTHLLAGGSAKLPKDSSSASYIVR